MFHIFYLCESSCDQRLNNMHETNRCIERYWNKECANDIDVKIDSSTIILLFVVLISETQHNKLLYLIYFIFTLNKYVFIIGTLDKWQNHVKNNSFCISWAHMFLQNYLSNSIKVKFVCNLKEYLDISSLSLENHNTHQLSI